jgi:ABC-type transport system involved in cytochrome c biogenesis permease subunit
MSPSFSGEAAFALACGVGILYLVQENSIKKKKNRFVLKRLPSLDLLDSTGYGCIVLGFTMLTLGLITGLVYAKSIWGRFWSWDPKEVWSGISWLFYAVLLHERLTVGWRGRKSAIMAIVVSLSWCLPSGGQSSDGRSPTVFTKRWVGWFRVGAKK